MIYSTNSFHEPAATCDRAVFLGCRGEVVLRLLLDTGVRVSELCGLALTDVGLGWQLAYVTGKGSRPRVVPFGARTAQAVDRYLRVRALKPHARSPGCSASAAWSGAAAAGRCPYSRMCEPMH